MKQATVANIRQRFVTPGRERWEIDALRKDDKLAAAIHQALSAHEHILKVVANPISGRVLIIYYPQFFQKGQIGQLLIQAIKDFDNGNGHTDSAAFDPNTQRQSIKQRLENNHLYQLVKQAEGNNKTRRKAIAYSAALSTTRLLSPISIGLMVSSVLFPLPVLTKAGLTKGMQLGIFTSLFVSARVLESYLLHRRNSTWSEYANNVEQELTQRTMQHVQALPMSYLESQNTERLMSIVNQDTDSIKRFLQHTPAELTEKATTLLIGSVAILLISPAAFLLTLVPVPFISKLNKKQQQATVGKYTDAALLTDEFNKILANNLNGLSTVKSFGAEDIEMERVSEAKRNVTSNAINIDKENSYYGSLHEFAFMVGIMGPIVYGCINVLNGHVNMTQFMIQNGIAPTLITSATGLEYSKSLYQAAKAAAQRIDTLLEIPSEWTNEHENAYLEDIQGGLSFDEVSFGYTDQLILKDISIKIAQKGKIAFVGPTGSGKSTLMKLLLRFHHIEQGQISLDGTDIQKVNLKSLRESIALVSQDPFMFNGTIYENLIYGRPDATFDEVVAACKVAQCYDFIQQKPEGFDSPVGERGNKLSGGQRQRLSIARAVLKDASILILDEATSAVDNETEAAIRESIEIISQNTTVIIIAHRLSTIRYVDTIYHLKDAQITESGSHDELLKLNGDYAQLWRLQTAEQSAPELKVVAKPEGKSEKKDSNNKQQKSVKETA